MIKRGFEPIFLSFLTSDDNQESMKKKVFIIIKVLSKFVKNPVKGYIITHDANLEIFQQKCERKLTCILCKRLMFRIAIEIGKKEKTNLIVSGDILGEQASQTLDNLISYNDLLNDFILIRPLIGWDKIEVINLNKQIKLYDITSQKSASCDYNPKYPETHAKLTEVFESERKININKIIIESINKAEILEL
jgi:thiamine biosynthesis protein ThiI